MNDYKLRYPIGEFEKPAVIDSEIIYDWIKIIEKFPITIRNKVLGLSDKEESG